MTEIPAETGVIRNDKGQIVPGSPSLNPNGRPEGSISIIGKIKKVFEEQPEFFDTYVAEVLADPKLRAEIIRQIDGAPKQTIAGDKDAPIVINMVRYGDSESPV